MLLGVTNPFFIKTFENWPHVVRLGETKMAAGRRSSFRALLLCFLTSRSPPGDLPKQLKVKKLSKLKMTDTKPGQRSGQVT